MKNRTQRITEVTCRAMTAIFGNDKCICYRLLGQTAVDLLNECFLAQKYLNYNTCTLAPLSEWVGRFDEDKASKLADFINNRFCTDITIEEIHECYHIDDLSNLLNEHTGRFFPDFCKLCVDNDD